MDLTTTIIPKSDQLNADDLITGTKTITITDVKAGSVEQPVIIHYEGDDGHPYKPGKSMRRVLVAMWGNDSRQYLGRALTLYRDDAVKYGGQEVGGIRISHASDIAEPFTIALTVTRGRRAPYRVEPLRRPPAAKASTAGTEPAPDLDLLRDIGRSKADEGMDVLRAWWGTLPAAVRNALKDTLDRDWKPLADIADAGKGGA